jgi:tRNA modification GTPase
LIESSRNCSGGFFIAPLPLFLGVKTGYMAANRGGWNDTIVALATAPGVAAIAVIRVSGTEAIAIANNLFAAKDLQQQPSHTVHVGMLRENGQLLDEAVVTVFKGPRSYTGENTAEIAVHGSPFVAEQVIQACIRAGARLAKPGEFTQRAFLNGKMDLTQAEAVADLIASNTAASSTTAIKNMRGGFSNALLALREQLIKFSALIELELDFAEEDVAFADRHQFMALIQQLQSTTRQLLHSFALGNVIRNGVQVAIIGKPNAGKSTLLNTLLNENRAIVSEVAGTTRDTIEEVINIDGLLFRLVDTAGIRSHTNDAIETIGVARAMEKRQQADLVLYLFDVHEISPAELAITEKEFNNEQLQYLLVGNKAEGGIEAATQKFNAFPHLLLISAEQHIYIDELKARLVSSVASGGINTEATLVTNTRHYEALQKLDASLQEVSAGLVNHLSGDLLALDIRNSLHWLGEITGEITNEDQLDYIFSKFCIGK